MRKRWIGSGVWLENVRVGADALRVHPLRTALSVLGILIGSAALIATMAVSDGMLSFAREQVLRHTSLYGVSLGPPLRLNSSSQARIAAATVSVPRPSIRSWTRSGNTTARVR